ncbi:hypothetical protein H4S03_001485, partial [Coemansia sp. S3946]
LLLPQLSPPHRRSHHLYLVSRIPIHSTYPMPTDLLPTLSNRSSQVVLTLIICVAIWYSRLRSTSTYCRITSSSKTTR